jgi:hypothetical protein
LHGAAHVGAGSDSWMIPILDGTADPDLQPGGDWFALEWAAGFIPAGKVKKRPGGRGQRP